MSPLFGKKDKNRKKAVPAPNPVAGSRSLDDLQAKVSSGGLSYLMGPPADYRGAAASLFMEGALAPMMGDDSVSLAKFSEALKIVAEEGHKPAEARLLYNLGLAHYKTGDLPSAIATLEDGKDLTLAISGQLAREARKARRFAEEMQLDAPGVEVFGAPAMDQELLGMFYNALAVVCDAAGRAKEAAGYRTELQQLGG